MMMMMMLRVVVLRNPSNWNGEISLLTSSCMHWLL
jgi:hypothetical protein